ncbi:MAG: hypothetical protein MZV63_34580 [Marinilabiliales bacterium]|nr:hypothetical protein [Marinilabiliales bacterium]
MSCNLCLGFMSQFTYIRPAARGPDPPSATRSISVASVSFGMWKSFLDCQTRPPSSSTEKFPAQSNATIPGTTTGKASS